VNLGNHTKCKTLSLKGGARRSAGDVRLNPTDHQGIKRALSAKFTEALRKAHLAARKGGRRRKMIIVPKFVLT